MARRARRVDADDSIWAPLADTMTLVACVFLLVFLAAIVFYKQAEGELARRSAERIQLLQERQKQDEELRRLVGERGGSYRRAIETLQAAATEIGFEKGADGTIRVGENLLFDTGKSDLVKGREALTRLVPFIRQALTTTGHSIIISGHTDCRPIVGRPYGNWDLSAARAREVLIFLLRAMPDIDPSRLVPVGHGDTRLLVADPCDHPSNRRVEIRVEPKVSDIFDFEQRMTKREQNGSSGSEAP